MLNSSKRDHKHISIISISGTSSWPSGEESAFQCRGQGFDPGSGTNIPHATWQLSPHTTTTELAGLNRRACMPQTTEPMCPGACASQLERENLHATTREKPVRCNEDPACGN